MAMINCPECGKEISDQAASCINCGYPIKQQNEITENNCENTGIVQGQKGKMKKISMPRYARWIIGILVLAIIVVVIITIISGIVRQNKMKQCVVSDCDNIRYKDGYCVNHYNEDDSVGSINEDGKDVDSSEEIAIEEDKVNSIKFTKDSKVTTDTTEFTFNGYSITRTVEPTTSETYYHYFEASSGNVFVDLKFTIKNLQNSDIQQDAVFDTAKVIYDDEYEYYASFVTVENNGDFNSFTSLYGISPLETMKYRLLAEVPNEVKESGKSLKIVITIGDETYECKLR